MQNSDQCRPYTSTATHYSVYRPVVAVPKKVQCNFIRTGTVEPRLSGPPLSGTSIIRLGSFLFIRLENGRDPQMLSNAHARCSCYHGDMPAYLLRMRRPPCGTAVYQ